MAEPCGDGEASQHVTITVISHNVGGLNDEKKRREYFKWLELSKPDIVLLQETFMAEEEKIDEFDMTVNETCNAETNPQVYHALSSSSHSKGIAILLSGQISKKVKEEPHYMPNDIPDEYIGCFSMITVPIEGSLDLTLCSMYVPNISDKEPFVKKSIETIGKHKPSNSSLIIGVDFNIDVDRTEKQAHKKIFDAFKKAFDRELVDLEPKNCDDQSNNTHYRDGCTPSRIDYFLVSKDVYVNKISCCIKASKPKKEHRALKLQFKVPLRPTR